MSYSPSNPPVVYDYAWLLSEFARISDELDFIGKLYVPRLAQVEFNGRPDNGPCPILLEYNTASVDRVGVGEYILTGGGELANLGVPLQGLTFYENDRIEPNLDGAVFYVRTQNFDPGPPATAEIYTYQVYISPAGKPEWIPYDLLATDVVSILILGEFA